MSEIISNCKSILITDCGSTTTKAIWFLETEKTWIVNARAEAATTVEKPVADVTIGVLNACASIQNMKGAKICTSSHLIKGVGCDVGSFLSTSSAGGGLQMVVLGVMGEISGKLSSKTALGGGAIILRAVSLDKIDDLLEVVESIREGRPDIILLTGGVDGGAKDQVFELANILLSAEPRPRFSTSGKIPLIYAGNKDLQGEISSLLGNSYSIIHTDNILPELGRESLSHAREAIHDVFLSHVMSQAPGYSKLMEWVDGEILPTPMAVSNMIAVTASSLDMSVLSVDIGGATTDVFSTRKIKGQFTDVERTVSANLGMSYSIGNVIESSGIENIERWLPIEVDRAWVEDLIWNKMYRPTTLPDSLEELLVEQAVAREALRLALVQHVDLVKGEKVISETEDFSKFFDAGKAEFSIADIDFILGSGGVLSHAPRRESALMIVLDAFRPKGLTFIGVDSVFMLPHLGTLASVNQQASVDILLRDCIIPLGTALSPVLKSKKVPDGEVLGNLVLKSGLKKELKMGMFEMLSIEDGDELKLVDPSSKVEFNLVPDNFYPIRKSLAGLILDFRDLDRFYNLSRSIQVEMLRKWYDALNLNYGT